MRNVKYGETVFEGKYQSGKVCKISKKIVQILAYIHVCGSHHILGVCQAHPDFAGTIQQ